MKKSTYINMVNYFKSNIKAKKLLIISNKIITYGIFLLYPLLMIMLFFTKNPLLIKSILVPLDGFIALSVFRYLVNRPRPYEKFETESVISKDTKGKSFPSRHVFSAGIIAYTYLNCGINNDILIITIIGIVLIIGVISLATIRVLSGVHYISDVIAGVVFATFIAYIGYWLF